MATASCTFSNWKWYKSGGSTWTGGSPTSTNIYAGGSYIGCLTFKTPTFSGTSSSLTLGLNIIWVNGSGITSSNLYCKIGTTNPGSSLLDPYSDTAVGAVGYYTTLSVTGLSSSSKYFTFTISNTQLQSNTTYYLWLYGGNAVQPYQASSTYNYIKLNYTVPTTTTYTITYYRNSTTSDTTTTSGGTVTSGTSYTLASCPWTRSGYSFNGWSTSRSASSGSAAGSTVAASTVNKNQVWYATWKSTVSSKTVQFYPMYTLTSGTSPGEKTAYSSSTTFTFPTASQLGWIRSGYTLSKWNTTRTSTGTNYSPGTTYSIAYANLQDSYYARWDTNTVTFTFEPGSYSDGSKSNYTEEHNESSTAVSLPGSDDYFTGGTKSNTKNTYYLTSNCNNGSFSNGKTTVTSSDYDNLLVKYVQTGWQLNNSVASGTRYTTYAPSSDKTFYPYWGSTSTSWQYGYVSLTIPSEIPTRSGYSFVEWNTRSTGTGISYSEGETIKQTNGSYSDITLYAIWEANTYTIYYKPTVYCIESSSRADTSATPNTSYSLSTSYFTGVTWNAASQTYYTNYNCNTGAFSNGATSVSTSNSTYKQYRYKQTAWQTNNSLNSGTPISTYNNSSGASSITLYPYMGSNIDNGYQNDVVFTILEAPVKVGWAFKGWNTSSAGTGTMYQPGDKITQSKSTANFYNTQLYAIWEPEWTVKINNGTSWSDYHVWIYTGATSNNGWQQAIPYVYDGSKWKLTSI